MVRNAQPAPRPWAALAVAAACCVQQTSGQPSIQQDSAAILASVAASFGPGITGTQVLPPVFLGAAPAPAVAPAVEAPTPAPMPQAASPIIDVPAEVVVVTEPPPPKEPPCDPTPDSLTGSKANAGALPWSLLGDRCDIDASGPICLGGQVLLPPALPHGLVGYWSFDDSLALDLSGHGGHGVLTVTPGPSFAGQGASAFFRRSFMAIPGSEGMNARDFSYTFWVYIVEHAGHHPGGPAFCPVVRKGCAATSEDDSMGQSMEPPSTPGIFYSHASKRLRVELATTLENGGFEVAAFESNARLTRGRWYHVAVVRLDGQRRTRLYVNGILDKSERTAGVTRANTQPLYVGGDPETQHKCDMPVYVDELKVYSRPLLPDEIGAEAAPALSGIEPSFVRLACIDCPLATAVENCPKGYHICNSLELHMGGYQVARTLGWLDRTSHVWSHAPVENEGLQEHGGLAPRPKAFQSGSALHGHAAEALGLPVAGGPAPAPAPAAAGAEPVALHAQQSQSALGLGICCADFD